MARRPLYLVTVVAAQRGYRPTDLYVRRFWSAVLGVGAVTDLLRIVQAGVRGNSLRRPVNLSVLLAAGLVHVEGNIIHVPDRIPPLDKELAARLPPALRRAHREWNSAAAKYAPECEAKRHDLANEKSNGDPQVGRTAPKRHRAKSRQQTANPGSGQLAS